LLPLPGDHDKKQQQQQKADPIQQEKRQQQAQQQPEHGQQQHQLQEEQQQGLSKHPAMPIPVFKDDDFMDSVLGHDKRGSILSEEAVQKLAAHYKQTRLVDHYQAAMRVCLKNQQQSCAAGGSSP